MQQDFHGALQEELGYICQKLVDKYGAVSLYPVGSLALNAFCPGKSDINLLLLLKEPVKEGEADFALHHDVRVTAFVNAFQPQFLFGQFAPGDHAFSVKGQEEALPPDTEFLLASFASMLGAEGTAREALTAEDPIFLKPLPVLKGEDLLLTPWVLPLYIEQALYAQNPLKEEAGSLLPVNKAAVLSSFHFLLQRDGQIRERLFFALSALAYAKDGLFLSKKGACIYGIEQSGDFMEKQLLRRLWQEEIKVQEEDFYSLLLTRVQECVVNYVSREAKNA